MDVWLDVRGAGSSKRKLVVLSVCLLCDGTFYKKKIELKKDLTVSHCSWYAFSNESMSNISYYLLLC